jgi:hypothetical protein
MIEIKAQSKENPRDVTTLFLAGGISNCPNWQADVVKALANTEYIILNPRQDRWIGSQALDTKIAYQEELKQVTWEYKRITKAYSVLFWFPKDTVCPITLFELGSRLEGQQNLFIGCDPDYEKRRNIWCQLEQRPRAVKKSADLHEREITLQLSLDDLIQEVIAFHDRTLKPLYI